MTTLSILVRVCVLILGFLKLETLGALVGSWSSCFSLRFCLCCCVCLCMFDAIDESRNVQ